MKHHTLQKAGRMFPLPSKRRYLIRFRLPVEIIRRLDRIARTLDISRSDVIRLAIGRKLKAPVGVTR